KLAAVTGFALDEYAPRDVLEKAVGQSVLSDLMVWNDLSYDRAKFVAVFIINLDGSVIASIINSDGPINFPALMAPPREGAFEVIGPYRLVADYLLDASGELVARGVADILQSDGGGEKIGSALVLFHAPGFPDDLLSIITGLSVLLLIQLCCLALVCWAVSSRHGANVRRLAEDMWVWADGDLSRRAEVRGTAEMALLAEAFNHMGERLRVVWAKERETTRLESDLSVAQKIQKSLMPANTPDIPGMDVHVIYRPAREIGGDYYDFLPIDDRRIGVIVADASGKSIPAALVMSTTRAVIRFVAMGGAGMIETLTRVNSVLGSSIPKGMFVTAFFLVFDIREHSIICTSAGHTPLLIARRDGTIESINPSGMALGFDAGPVFRNTLREQRVEFYRGDRALLTTDGVIECVNSSHEEYSERRLTEFLRRNRDMTSQDFLGALMADLDLHRGGTEMLDDTTAVTFRIL
ncbi:MAG: PP2C family protein-serine/threonine phosphatase, partial [Planctomycetota bacterium]|nr:PP2C family protein-serine/threonine phosphatase [Planctomycetota bacterium]